MAKMKGLRELNVKLGKIGPASVEEVHRALRRGALAIERRAVEGIIDSGSARNPKPSKPGEFPAAKTGELHQSITSVDASDGTALRFEVGTNVPHGTYLELGTSKMEPRPFMAPSFDAEVPNIKANIRAAVKRGIRRGAR